MADHFLMITALVTAGYQFFFFLIGIVFKFDKLTDFAGGSNFAVLVFVTAILKGSLTLRQVILSLLVVIWSLREAFFLLFRILQWGEDWRYKKIHKSLMKVLVFWIVQGIWVWMVSLPVILANASNKDAELQLLDIIGWSLWLIGFLIEVISDQQKLKFKNDPTKNARWCNIGLWKFSRHPNYFGEILLWWGVFLASLPVLGHLKWLAVCSPIFTMYLLLFVSGMPILERSADKRFGNSAEYREYKRHTSPLVLLPSALYGKLPQWLKQIFLFEWPLYSRDLFGTNQPFLADQ